MPFLAQLRKSAGWFLRSEGGMVLPTALFATIAAFGLGTAAVVATVNAQHGTTRDNHSKEAIAAADAGASVALMRLNRYASALTVSTPCLGMSGSTLVLTNVAADGWCPEVNGTVGGSTYAYRVTPQTGGGLSVVAAGSSGEVSRRIAIALTSSTVGSVLEDAGVIGVEDITLSNSADIRVGVGTNGNVKLGNNSSICGNIRHGVGKETTFTNNSHQCSGYGITEGNQSLPPVSSFIPADISTNNSNYRLAMCTSTKPEKIPLGCQSDSYVANGNRGFTSTVPWNPSTRTISTDQNSTLTLTGGDYFICRLVLSNNSHLIMGATAHVRIFFDTPENCKLKAGAEQLSLSNNTDIQATGNQGSAGNADLPGLYLMGSTAIPTKATFANNTGTTNEFVLYAPNTDIVIENNATYKGVLAGKTVTLTNNATVEQDAAFEPPEIGGAKLFARQSYVECVGATGSPPNANC
jgi:hypothetical protein